jgi:M6 family metalloprotease-like protein
MKRILYAIIFITLHATAANYNGEIKSFSQPDGNKVDVMLYGSEYYMRAEGLDGYTLIRDSENHWICYAKLSADGNSLESTGEIYHGIKNDPSTLRNDINQVKHLQINLDARHRQIEQMKSQLDGPGQQLRVQNNGASFNGTPIFHPAGNIVGLCIVIDFSDQPASVPISEFTAFCNDMNYTNYGNNGSVRRFYWDISGGLLDYQNVVFGYYRAPQTFAYYDSQPMGTGARSILGQALNWIASTGFDFSTLSLNPDNTIMAINMMYTGDPPTWGQGMWFHKGSYSGFNWNGIRSNVYNTSPASAPLSIATVVHENGHMVCKWPDTYKYDQSEDGIGAFDLMCATGSPNNPVPPNPLFRSNAGWGDVIDVTSYHGMNYDTSNSMIAYR